MGLEKIKIKGYNGSRLLIRRWIPDNKIVACIHILHGMAEHSLRYDEFARYLNTQGILVIAHDHRQHGYSIAHDDVGILDKSDTWDAMVKDVGYVQEFINKKYKDMPSFMLGHSMGSLLLRCFLQTEKPKLSGVILTGTPISIKGFLYAGMFLSKIIGSIKGDNPNRFLDQIAVGVFNKSVDNPRTPYDWISRDEDIVNEYVSDPLSGYSYNPKFYEEMSKGSLKANKKSYMKQFVKVPLLLISGGLDPCGNNGKGVKQLGLRYKVCGIENKVTIKSGMRHEVINELHNEEVYKQISQFINENSNRR